MFFDVTIIGAGVVGLSIAKFCSEQGYSVVVLEQESRAGEGVSSRIPGFSMLEFITPKIHLKLNFAFQVISCFMSMPISKESIIKELANM
jgi:flavin-dependent dehydrogenase